MATEAKHAIIDALWRDRMHIEPRALELSLQLNDSSRGGWSPFERLRPYLATLPTGLLEFWRASERGHLVYTHRPSEYVPGTQLWQEREFEGVCYLSMGELVATPDAALEALFAMLDHLMGSRCDPQGPWFSDGAGVTPQLVEAAARLARIHALGYGHAALGATSARDYMARAWALYLTDPQRLNVLDPQVFKLYRDVLMSERFWAQVWS